MNKHVLKSQELPQPNVLLPTDALPSPEGPKRRLAAIRAYREVCFDGPIRPDHVPQFAEEEGEPGYTMQGRLFAYGYILALLQATEN